MRQWALNPASVCLRPPGSAGSWHRFRWARRAAIGFSLWRDTPPRCPHAITAPKLRPFFCTRLRCHPAQSEACDCANDLLPWRVSLMWTRNLHLLAPFFAVLVFRTDALAMLLASPACILYTTYAQPWEDPLAANCGGRAITRRRGMDEGHCGLAARECRLIRPTVGPPSDKSRSLHSCNVR